MWSSEPRYDSPSVVRRRSLRALVALTTAVAVPACGFRLRGSAAYNFRTLHLATANGSPFYTELRQGLASSGDLRVVATPAEAEAILELTPPNPIDDKSILSLSGGGKVREYRLTKRIAFRVHDGKGGEWLPTNEIVIRREFSYDDTLALAKELEERSLLADMQSDAIRQLVRRLELARRPAG